MPVPAHRDARSILDVISRHAYPYRDTNSPDTVTRAARASSHLSGVRIVVVVVVVHVLVENAKSFGRRSAGAAGVVKRNAVACMAISFPTPYGFRPIIRASGHGPATLANEFLGFPRDPSSQSLTATTLRRGLATDWLTWQPVGNVTDTTCAQMHEQVRSRQQRCKEMTDVCSAFLLTRPSKLSRRRRWNIRHADGRVRLSALPTPRRARRPCKRPPSRFRQASHDLSFGLKHCCADETRRDNCLAAASEDWVLPLREVIWWRLE